MWLLHTTSLTRWNFISRSVEYATLSHTWGLEEVTFKYVFFGRVEDKRNHGYKEIYGSCRQAARNGFNWI
jgi:hypothetical protein